MKKRHVVLAILAVAFVLTSSIGTAIAYFTTFVTAKGGYVIHLENSSEIEETYEKGVKTLSIKNTAEAGKYPIFIRARAFAGDDYVMTAAADSENKWDLSPAAPLDTDYWYYTEAIYGQESTAAMTIEITYADHTKEWKDGNERNIIVVYESTPAIFTVEGDPDFETAWAEGIVKVIQEGGNG